MTNNKEETNTVQHEVEEARRVGYFPVDLVNRVVARFAHASFSEVEPIIGITEPTQTHDLPGGGRLGYSDSPYYGRPSAKDFAKRATQVAEMIEGSERRRQQ